MNTIKRKVEALKINVIKSVNNYYIVVNSVKSNEKIWDIVVIKKFWDLFHLNINILYMLLKKIKICLLWQMKNLFRELPTKQNKSFIIIEQTFQTQVNVSNNSKRLLDSTEKEELVIIIIIN